MKVLIVDDSRLAVFSLKEVLSRIEEVEIVGIANDGEAGYRLYRELEPDLVIMDMVMPGVSGSECTKQIFEHDPSAKIIVVSGVGGAQDKIYEELEKGAITVISKPFEEKVIRNAIEQIMK
ncbi:response regulator [bacterium]|nr:response regulator [bacterium]